MSEAEQLQEYQRMALWFLDITTPIDEQNLKKLLYDKLTEVRFVDQKLHLLLEYPQDVSIRTIVYGKLAKMLMQLTVVQKEHKLLSEELQKKSAEMEKKQEYAADKKQQKKEIANLKQQLLYKNEYINKIKPQLEEATNKIDELQFYMKKADRKLAILTEENKQSAALKANIYGEKSKFTERIKELESETLEKSKKIEEIKRSFVATENNLAEKYSELKKLEGTMYEKSMMITELQLKIVYKDEKYEKMEERKNKEIKSLNQEILMGQRKYENLKASSDSKISQLELEHQKLKNYMKKATEDLVKERYRKIKEINDYFEAKEKRWRYARIKYISDLTKRAEKDEQQLKYRHAREIHDLTEDYEKRIFDSQQAFLKLSKDKGKLQYSLKHYIIVLKKDIDDLQYKILQKEEIIAKLYQDVVELKEYIKNHLQTIDYLRQKIFVDRENSNQQIYYLGEEIKKINEEKEYQGKRDKKTMDDAILALQSEHSIVLDSIRGTLYEYRYAEINILKTEYVEYQHRAEEMEKYLREQLRQLTAKYDGLTSVYEGKHSEQYKHYKYFINSLNERHKYELEVQAELKEREKVEIRSKYEMYIKSIEEAFAKERVSLATSFVEEKSSALTKLKNSYESEIELIKRDMTLEMKQKCNEYYRKIKLIYKKVSDEQNTNRQLSSELEKLKAETKMKLESMTELHYRNEEEGLKLKEYLEALEIQKEQQREEFERCILRLETEIVQLREEYKKKEEYLLESCRKKIANNLTEMKNFADNMKQYMNDLDEKHNNRLELLNRYYKYLQHMYQQRSSKPEDIEALKVMHRAYIEKEMELVKERELIVDLRRQLNNRYVAQKLFGSKQLDGGMRVTLDAPFPIKKKI